MIYMHFSGRELINFIVREDHRLDTELHTLARYREGMIMSGNYR